MISNLIHYFSKPSSEMEKCKMTRDSITVSFLVSTSFIDSYGHYLRKKFQLRGKGTQMVMPKINIITELC